MKLKSTGIKVSVSTNGKPLQGRITYRDVRTLWRDNFGNLCVVVKNKVIYDQKYWEYLKKRPR